MLLAASPPLCSGLSPASGRTYAAQPLLTATQACRASSHQVRFHVRAAQQGSSAQRKLTADDHWAGFWDRFQIGDRRAWAGYVGKFVSFAPGGCAPGDARFQDAWLRAFKEDDGDGKFSMRIIRTADQSAGAWPRAGRQRPDGNDEIVLEGERHDSSTPAGFWHPYTRSATLLTSRVVALDANTLATVTLRLPSPDTIAAAGEYDFVCGLEAVFHHGDLRFGLAASYKAGGGGSLLFHQTFWDPVFLAALDPDAPIDITQVLDNKRPGAVLQPSADSWLDPRRHWTGSARRLQFDPHEQSWSASQQPAAWTPPPTATDAQTLIYRYDGGAYAAYPAVLPPAAAPGAGQQQAAGFTAEVGCLLSSSCLRRCIWRYGTDRWIESVTVEEFVAA